MKHKKIIIPILIVISILFIFSVFPKTFTGNVVFELDNSKPMCFYESNNGKYFIENINNCCKDVEKQLICENIVEEDFSVMCFVKSGGDTYKLNNNAWDYCQNEGYQIEKI